MNNIQPPRRENTKLKIVLYTTAGCEACRIAKNILEKVMEKYDFHYYIHEITFSDSDKAMAKELKLHDFPTLMLKRITLAEDIEIWRLEGTYPKDYIEEKIDNTLKIQNYVYKD